jgi:hypothetical protein
MFAHLFLVKLAAGRMKGSLTPTFLVKQPAKGKERASLPTSVG